MHMDKPGSRTSHYGFKFGLQTSKTVRYCQACMECTDAYIKVDGVSYSLNKKNRFKFVEALRSEIDERRNNREINSRKKNRKAISATGNCCSFAVAKIYKTPTLPKKFARRRCPDYVRKPIVFPIKIKPKTLYNVINGKFDSLSVSHGNDGSHFLCYLLENAHSYKHQVIQAKLDTQGGYPKQFYRGGGDDHYAGIRLPYINKLNTVQVVAGTQKGQWCTCHDANKKWSERDNPKIELRRKRDNRKAWKWEKVLQQDWHFPN